MVFHLLGYGSGLQPLRGGVILYEGHKMGQIVLEAHAVNETKCSYYHQKFGEICIWSPTTTYRESHGATV